ELANPIRPKVNRPLKFCRITDAAAAATANEGMLRLYEQAIEKEWLKQLHRLMDEYGIADKSDFRSLSLALALELDIPGFRVDVEYFNRGSMQFRPTPFRLTPFKLGPLKGQLVVQDNRKGRPPKKQPRGLQRHVAEVKKKHGISTDKEVLQWLAS